MVLGLFDGLGLPPPPPPPPPAVLLGDKLAVGVASDWSSVDGAEITPGEVILPEEGAIRDMLGIDAEGVMLPNGTFESVLGDIEAAGVAEIGNRGEGEEVLPDGSSRRTAPGRKREDAETLKTLVAPPCIVDPDDKETTGTKEGGKLVEDDNTDGVTTIKTGGPEADVDDDLDNGVGIETLGIAMLPDGTDTEVDTEDVLAAGVEFVETDITTPTGRLEEDADDDALDRDTE